MAKQCDNCKPDLCLFAGGGSGGGGGGSSTLSGLTDVDISNPTNGQTLVYNATSGKWENGESAGGVLVVTVNEQTELLDHTAQQLIDAGKRGVVILPLDLRPYGEDEIGFYVLVGISYIEEYWAVTFASGPNTQNLYATELDDYPSINPPTS